MLMGGGWSQEELHPPPKGVTRERERGEKNREMTRNESEQFYISLYDPYGVYIVHNITVT